MRKLVWFASGDRLDCPFNFGEEEQNEELCNGDCIFWCELEDEVPEKSSFDCMLRLALLKYLGLDYRK